MDRYVIREARVGANYPQGNQIMAFSTNTGRSNLISPDTVYYGGSYTNQFANMQHVSNSSFADVGNVNTPVIGQNIIPAQGQMMTGIDPRYLANYSDNSAQYILAGQPMQHETAQVSNDISFGSNYQYRSFTGVEKNKQKIFTQGFNSGQPLQKETAHMSNDRNFGSNYQNRSFPGVGNYNAKMFTQEPNAKRSIPTQNTIYDASGNRISQPNNQVVRKENKIPQIEIKESPKVAAPGILKKHQNQTKLRAERLQALHKSGPRAFSGPVEKVLKWHKALQDIGVFIFYEIVAKCVNIRSGESFAKNLVIRDDNGPAMQVVYYEIDFMLPELKVPSTVRVIGRMMPGTCRLQAFSVRPATGDDDAMLPRRAAVAAHHVAKLCKEYGTNI